jgi:two-component system, cell cycle response regulator DivK
MALGTRCDVLIVEDNALQCDEMADFLTRADLLVAKAYNGAEAREQARMHEPRVVLLDFNLPDMTGVQLAETLRALLPTAAILMMSGRIDGLSERTLEALGITVFVNKPVPLVPLRQAVLKLVEQSRSGQDAPQQKGWLGTGVGGRR